ncbi:hypothetical protein cypCar_00003428 [Cyprinus carpio]|nr:hypothetical protein cypCar_00003428 [Cyprinus carpio]
MEKRARQHAERRRETEERRRQKQEEKLAQMKAAEEERLRAEEEEKQKKVERKKEEKMQQRKLKDLRFILEAHAEQFHRTQTQKVFMALLDHAREERIRTWDNEQRGEAHNSRRAVKKCFAGWRHLPVVLQEEKEREARREQLRRKVAEILPDFRY